MVKFAGQAVDALYGPMLGGLIVNPATAKDQGIQIVEVLYVDITGPAALGETNTTTKLQPGQVFQVPLNQTTNVSVNAATPGHKFSGLSYQPIGAYTPSSAAFPPSGPTTLTQTIPSYLYQEYSDDDDLQAFVTTFNNLVQAYVSWFVNIGLPVYTGPLISGSLLDWVVQGLYGLTRPVLPYGLATIIGPLNTWAPNLIPLNTLRLSQPNTYYPTTDDVFKRILTWHFYKGDGKVFDIRWLKRRIARFLFGVNGTAPNIDQTYQISVTFGVGNQVNIRILPGIRTVIGGALLNRFGCNYKSARLNSLFTTYQSFPIPALAPIFKAAVEAGVLELPFQEQWIVTV